MNNAAKQAAPAQDFSSLMNNLIPGGYVPKPSTPTKEYMNEAKKFLARTGGRTLCTQGANDTEGTLLDFFYTPTAAPNEKCLYVLSYYHIHLTASQAIPQGILVGATWSLINRFIFLYNDNKIDDEVVDGSTIQPGYFIYVGNFSYTSMTGPRKVYAFKRIDDPFKGLQIYDGRPLALSNHV